MPRIGCLDEFHVTDRYGNPRRTHTVERYVSERGGEIRWACTCETWRKSNREIYCAHIVGAMASNVQVKSRSRSKVRVPVRKGGSTVEDYKLGRTRLVRAAEDVLEVAGLGVERAQVFSLELTALEVVALDFVADEYASEYPISETAVAVVRKLRALAQEVIELTQGKKRPTSTEGEP